MLDRGVEIFTLGQYLRPSKRHMPVVRMVPPEEYDEWQREGMAMGLCAAAPARAAPPAASCAHH